MAEKRYKQVYAALKSKLQQGSYAVGTYLPSEHDLCRTYSITRTTARRALDELFHEGFIEKEHGRGSRVVERRNSLGLLTVKGFSEAVVRNVRTVFIQKPELSSWPEALPFPAGSRELKTECIYFERLRCVGEEPVMIECNWMSGSAVPGFMDSEFVDDSFFKTLSSRYLIEISSSEQELRAIHADQRSAGMLNTELGAPLLKISIKFSTTNPDLNIYSYLYCNTNHYPIGNSYNH